MRVIIDGDACPVIKISEKICKNNNVPLIIVKNHAHQIYSRYAEVISVDGRSENADFKIANLTQPGDLVITQDYGLCAMVIAKEGFCINQYGQEINRVNVDLYLHRRDFNLQMRKKHKTYTKFKKRTKKDDQAFKESFEKLIKKAKTP